jgi:hypothetical protein
MKNIFNMILWFTLLQTIHYHDQLYRVYPIQELSDRMKFLSFLNG